MFGAHNLNDTHEVDRIMLRPEKIVLHEDWDPTASSYDANISLLKFEEGKINLNSYYINPICIWDSIDYPIAEHDTIVGWGWSEYYSKPHENLPKMTYTVIENFQECLFNYTRISIIGSRRTLCGVSVEGFHPCFGDTGAGLFVEIDGIYYLKGIISAGAVDLFGECEPQRYSVFTDINKFTDWIKTKTQGAYSTRGSTRGNFNSHFYNTIFLNVALSRFK